MKKCSETGCKGEAKGYLPLENDKHLLCQKHFNQKQDAGLFVLLLGQQICPKCSGKSWISSKHSCSKCEGQGFIVKPKKVGRPFGAFKTQLAVA